MKLIFFFLFLASALAENSTNYTVGANDSSNNSCNGPFYTSARFKAWGLKWPAYLSQAAVSTNLTYCKQYNNVSSCCNETTDQQIASFYSNYKVGLGSLTGKRMKKMKELFEAYKTISINSAIYNGTDLTSNLVVVVNNIKAKWILINKEMVSCARGALNVSVGLLCAGCSSNWSASQQNGKILLNKNACVKLADSCFRLVQSFNETQNSSQDDAMNLTDVLTEYIGEDVASANDTEAVFGNISDVNLTDNETGRILSSKKKIAEAFTNTETESTVVTQVIKLLVASYSSLKTSSFLVCNSSSTEQDCTNHTMLPNFTNASQRNEILSAFKQKSQWGFIPISVKFNITGKQSTTAELHLSFLFTTLKNNKDLIKLLLTKSKTANEKLAKVKEIEKSMISALLEFIQYYKYLAIIGTDKDIVDKDTLRSNDQKLLRCVFEGLIEDFTSVNKSIFTDSCDFNITLGNQSNSTVCNTTVGLDIKDQLNECKKKTIEIDVISGTCSNMSCIICLDDSCFSQSFKFNTTQNDSFNEYSKLQGRIQFQKDSRTSLKTGKRVPDFINLPDISFLTDFNYTAPCQNLSDCSVWFCTKFLKGPVARIEKIYNPQDSTDDELDGDVSDIYAETNSTNSTDNSSNGTNSNDSSSNETNNSNSSNETATNNTNETNTNDTNATNTNETNSSDTNASESNSTGRLLQTSSSSDVEISDNQGLDFNQIAGQTSFDTSVSIDGVNVSASTYTDTTSNTTDNNSNNNGSYGNRGFFNFIAFTCLIILVSFLI